MKIHLVTVSGDPTPRLVRAHTRAGAAKYVRDQIKPEVMAVVPSQDVLVAALSDGIQIEDATSPAFSPADQTINAITSYDKD